MCKLGVISQERLKIEVKLLFSGNWKSYMPRRLAQQRMTLSDLECLKSTLSASRAISAVAELVVIILSFYNQYFSACLIVVETGVIAHAAYRRQLNE